MGNKFSQIKEWVIKKIDKSDKSSKSPTVSTLDMSNSEELKYPIPSKSDSLTHFQSPHYTLRYLWQNNYSVPVEEILLSTGVVLDAGCGFSAWLIDMATEYPTTDFAGVDLNSQQFPPKVPENVKLTQANILSGLPFEDSGFDFVRLCYFANTFACCEWVPAAKELARVTKPGGWIEFVEPDLVPTNMGPKFTLLMNASRQIIGERSNIAERLELVLNSTNQLKNLRKESKSLTIGSLGGDIGISYENSIKEYLIDESSQFRNHLGMSLKEYGDLLDDISKEFQTRKVEVKFFRIYAQKIET